MHAIIIAATTRAAIQIRLKTLTAAVADRAIQIPPAAAVAVTDTAAEKASFRNI